MSYSLCYWHFAPSSTCKSLLGCGLMRTIPPTNPVQHTVATASSSKCAKRVGVGRFSMGNRLTQPAEKLRKCRWKILHLDSQMISPDLWGMPCKQARVRPRTKAAAENAGQIDLISPLNEIVMVSARKMAQSFLEVSIISCHDIILINVNHINHKLSTKLNKEPDC